jgi:hypothetical protein
MISSSGKTNIPPGLEEWAYPSRSFSGTSRAYQTEGQRDGETLEMDRPSGVKYLFLASEEEMEEIQKQLPLPQRRSRSAWPPDPRDPDHKILSAMEALQTLSRERSEALARQIIDEARPWEAT